MTTNNQKMIRSPSITWSQFLRAKLPTEDKVNNCLWMKNNEILSYLKKICWYVHQILYWRYWLRIILMYIFFVKNWKLMEKKLYFHERNFFKAFIKKNFFIFRFSIFIIFNLSTLMGIDFVKSRKIFLVFCSVFC